MKPSWDDAPEWAKWLAMDYDGEWTWFEDLPTETSGIFGAKTGRTKYAGMADRPPSLEPRP